MATLVPLVGSRLPLLSIVSAVAVEVIGWHLVWRATGWFPLASALNRIRSSCRSNRMALSVAIYNVDTAIFRLLTLECGKTDTSRNLVTLTVCPATNAIGNLTE
jgi:hypothetical protein